MNTKQQKNLYDNVHFITAVLTIVSIIAAFHTASEIGVFNISPNANFGVCSFFSSGSTCFYNTNFLCKNENLKFDCENKGRMRIDLEIYNKGLFLATDVEIECGLIGSDFSLSDNNLSFGYFDTYVDGQKINSNKIYNASGRALISYDIHTLKSNEVKTVSFLFPSNFGFYTRPSAIKITLKEDGVEKLTKMVYINYKPDNRTSCNNGLTPITPYPLGGTLTSNGLPLANIKILIKDLQTGSEQIFNTAADGSYAFDFGNFEKCWGHGDIIEIKYCKNATCEILGYKELQKYEDAILLDFEI